MEASMLGEWHCIICLKKKYIILLFYKYITKLWYAHSKYIFLLHQSLKHLYIVITIYNTQYTH